MPIVRGSLGQQCDKWGGSVVAAAEHKVGKGSQFAFQFGYIVAIIQVQTALVKPRL